MIRYLSERLMTVILLAMMVGLVIGCSGDDTGKTDAQPPADAVAETPTETPAPDAPIQMTDGTVKHIEKAYEPVKEKWDLNGSPLTIGGLIYKPASQWTDHGVQGEKLAFYTYGPLRDDTYPSRLSVRFVPSASAAGYMDYFTAWLERLDLSHLKDPSAAAIRHDREADSMTVHVQSVMGGYLPEADEHVEGEILPRKSYRVVGIVVEAPEGLVLFELSGPDATAMTMIEAFMNGIYQLKRI